MSKGRAIMAFRLILLCLIASMVVISITTVRADNTDYTNVKGQLIMTSPTKSTIYKGIMPLNFTINLSENEPVPWLYVTEISYGIDNENPISLPIPTSDKGYLTFWSSSTIIPINADGLVNISNLANGVHTLTITANGACNVDDDGVFAWNVSLVPVYFSVYNLPPPNILVFAPQNKTYSVANASLISIPLNFTVDKSTSWVGYSLDNQDNVTLTGNSTVTGLSYGNHSLIIFANDTIGNMGASQTINFTVEKPPPTQTIGSSIIIAVMAVPVSVCLVAGLLLFRRHRKTANLEQ